MSLVEKKSAKTFRVALVFAEVLKRIERRRSQRHYRMASRPTGAQLDRRRTNHLFARPNSPQQISSFPTFWFENTSQGKFMLSIAFGQANIM
jgi:site-specific DNA recombinase